MRNIVATDRNYSIPDLRVTSAMLFSNGVVSKFYVILQLLYNVSGHLERPAMRVDYHNCCMVGMLCAVCERTFRSIRTAVLFRDIQKDLFVLRNLVR